jgi:hypothetical protein
MADPITLPVQQINADAGWAERAREKMREMYAQMTPTPAERARQEADAAKSFADLATTKGLVSRGLAHVLGPMQGSSLPATAGMSALEAYADDPQHRAGRALAAGAGAAALGAGASVAARKAAQLFGPAAQVVPAATKGKLVIQPAAPTPLPGSWDPAKVEQVLGNATARKAMKGESVQVSEKALERIAARKAGRPKLAVNERPGVQQELPGVPEPQYQYHATAPDNARGIAELGLRPEEGGKNFKFKKNAGRVYMSGPEHADMWAGKLRDVLGSEPVRLRTPLGSQAVPGADASVRIRTEPVPPERLQYLAPTGSWRPIKSLLQ